MALGVALAVVGLVSSCAGGSQRRYEALASEFRETRRGRGAAEDAEEAIRHLERLDRGALVRAVLARNPDLEAARQAWRAALARHPQETSLDDPMLSYSFAPLALGSAGVRFGQAVNLSQDVPWPGKLSLAGDVALARAEAAMKDYEAARLELGLSASVLFDRYYANARSLELNEEHRQLMEDILAVAEAQFEAGAAPQQDALQADVELAHVVHRRVLLESEREILVARLNGLLHRPPEAPLPPPPERIEPVDLDLEDLEALQEQALRGRPELRAQEARIEGRAASVDLAQKQYYPDFSVIGSWNSMWAEVAHRWMVGVSLNIPIQLGRRRGAVDEAEAKLRRTRAELEQRVEEIRVEVKRALERADEAEHVARLYRERLLPSARAQIEAAQIAYETGSGGFQALIDAERSLRRLELEYQQAIAELGLRRAALERAVGRVPGLPGKGADDEL